MTALIQVFEKHRFLDEALLHTYATPDGAKLEPRDRAFVRVIVTAVLRRAGELGRVLDQFLQKPLDAKQGRLRAILLSAAAQILCLETPAHAAISLAVDQCKADTATQRFAGLTNAVLRKVASDGPAILKGVDAVSVNIPAGIYQRWQRSYGQQRAAEIAAASLAEPDLDLTVKSDPEAWAHRLGGVVLPAGSVRLSGGGRIEDLPGYAEGAWWVQDAAAALPVLLLGDVSGKDVADLCAAPGGKTAQLAARGASVWAVENSKPRLTRLAANLERVRLTAKLVEADAASWAPTQEFDAVLLDAPCSATGTIRRHPDLLHIKQDSNFSSRLDLQARLLDNAARLVKPGGLLLYCTCSLEREEGLDQVQTFLERNAGFARRPLSLEDVAGQREWLSPEGDLRTLPDWRLDTPPTSGIDGFYAARLFKA